MNDHADRYAAETAALVPTAWERWIDRVEELLGHTVDGDVNLDGFSVDTFADMFAAGLSAKVAATRIRRAVFVTPDGVVYQLHRAEQDPWSDVYGETYTVMRPGGGFTNAETLPVDATLVWRPRSRP